MHCTTKYIDGHNATVGGAVVAKTAELDERIQFIQNSTGTIMSPQVAWLTLQGTKTLSVRMDRQSDNAMQIARFLETHPKVTRLPTRASSRSRSTSWPRRQAAGFRRHGSGSRSRAASRPARS